MGDLERMLDLYGPLWIMMIAWIGLQYIWFLGCLVLSPLVGFVLLALLTPGRGGPRRPA